MHKAQLWGSIHLLHSAQVQFIAWDLLSSGYWTLAYKQAPPHALQQELCCHATVMELTGSSLLSTSSQTVSVILAGRLLVRPSERHWQEVFLLLKSCQQSAFHCHGSCLSLAVGVCRPSDDSGAPAPVGRKANGEFAKGLDADWHHTGLRDAITAKGAKLAPVPAAR